MRGMPKSSGTARSRPRARVYRVHLMGVTACMMARGGIPPAFLFDRVKKLARWVRQCPYPRIDTVWRVAGARPIEIRREGAHLVLQLGKGPMWWTLPALFIQRGDRF